MSVSTTAGYYIGFNSPDAFMDTTGIAEPQWSPWLSDAASLFDFSFVIAETWPRESFLQ